MGLVGGLAVPVGKILAAIVVGQLIDRTLTRKEKRGQADSLLGLPMDNLSPGAPTNWAIGNKIRVPAQVLWKKQKERSSSVGSKLKSGTPVKHVSVDVAFALNDRYTVSIDQFLINEQLLVWRERNVSRTTTSGMSASISGGRLLIEMDDFYEDDFNDRFEVDQVISLANWVIGGTSPDINLGYWAVYAITPHGEDPSTITLIPLTGQTLTGLDVSAGVPSSPASVIRVIDAVIDHQFTLSQATIPAISTKIAQTSTTRTPRLGDVFKIGDIFKVTQNGTFQAQDSVVGFVGKSRMYARSVQTTFNVGTSSNAAVVEFAVPRTVADGYLPQGYSLDNYFYPGSETQVEDSTIVAAEGAGTVGGFRGICYVVMPSLNLDEWGGSMPPVTEAVIRPDPACTWRKAITYVCERYGLPVANVDVEDVDDRTFEGMYVQGPLSGNQPITTMLLIGQIVTQERGDKLAFFDIDNADVVQIVNSTTFSHFGSGGKTDIEKFTITNQTPEDLPTDINLYYQDIDENYASNVQSWALRNPSQDPADRVVQSLQFANYAMTRKQARNLCATLIRRAWINNGVIDGIVLPPSYIDLLENDLVTFTGDDGRVYLTRIIEIRKRADFSLNVKAVLEKADVAVSGSPVQAARSFSVSNLPVVDNVVAVIIDGPPVYDVNGLAPALGVVACAPYGSHWSGASVFVSYDNQQTWHQVATLNQEHPIGVLSEVLGAGPQGESLGSSTLVWDDSATATVTFESVGTVALSSATEQDVANGWQWFAVIDVGGQVLEIFGAATVSQVDDQTWELTHLLRGLRGTSSAADLATGYRVVGVSNFFSISGEYVAVPGASIAQSISLKFVPPGKTVNDVDPVSVAPNFNNVRSFPVRDITKTIDGVTYDATFEFDHWTRFNFPPGFQGPYPLDQAREVYRVTIYDPTGSAVRRVINVYPPVGSNTVRDKWITYSAADQTTDGYTPSGSETFWIDVQQVSDLGTLSTSVKQEL